MTGPGAGLPARRRPPTADPRLLRKVQSAPQQVATTIKEAILEGSLLPGARLPSEEEMAANFGVSRPTVREALRGLKTAGVIRATRGRNGGHSVSEFAGSSLALGMGEYMTLALDARELSYRDLFEVRFELELLSAQAAAEHRTPDDVAALDGLVVLRPVGDEESWSVAEALRYDLAFHRRLAACSHNPLVLAFVGATIIAFQGSGFDTGVFTAPDLVAHLDDVHASVAAGDPAGARAAMARHLEIPRRQCGWVRSPSTA